MVKQDPRVGAHAGEHVEPSLNLYPIYLLACSVIVFGIGWFFLKHQTVSYMKGDTPTNGQRLFMAWFSLVSSCVVFVVAIREFRREVT